MRASLLRAVLYPYSLPVYSCPKASLQVYCPATLYSTNSFGTGRNPAVAFSAQTTQHLGVKVNGTYKRDGGHGQPDQAPYGQQPSSSGSSGCGPVCERSSTISQTQANQTTTTFSLGIEIAKTQTLNYSNQETAVTVGESVRDEDGPPPLRMTWT